MSNIGKNPDQIPVNGMLGKLAFVDKISANEVGGVLPLSGGTMTGNISFNAGQTFTGVATNGKAIAFAMVMGF